MKIKKKKYLIISLFSFLALFFAAFTLDDDFETIKNITLLNEIVKNIKLNYAENIETAPLVERSIILTLQELDPYTVFYNQSSVAEGTLKYNDSYSGIGASITRINDNFYISEIQAGMPADLSGLKITDKVVSINGIILNKDAKKFDDILFGEPGSKLEIVIERNHENHAFSIERKQLKQKCVTHFQMISDSIGYIKLVQFMPDASNEFSEAFKQLKQNKNFSNLIIDLRGNPGGLLNEAVKITGLFIPKDQLIVTIRGNSEEKTTQFRTNEQPEDELIPIIVMVDEFSASASEIVAGALQDHDRAVIIGRKTYGKGLVQNTVNLSYNTKLKMTTAKYYLPSGRCIQSKNYKALNTKQEKNTAPKIFYTKSGRFVTENGGITPDVFVNNLYINELTQYVEDKNIYFKYICEKDNSLSTNLSLGYSEELFDEFWKYVQSNTDKFKSKSEIILENLDSLCEAEIQINGVNSKIMQLKTETRQHYYSLSPAHKSIIYNNLISEILRATNQEKARFDRTLETDNYFSTALKLFKDKNAYTNSINK